MTILAVSNTRDPKFLLHVFDNFLCCLAICLHSRWFWLNFSLFMPDWACDSLYTENLILWKVNAFSICPTSIFLYFSFQIVEAHYKIQRSELNLNYKIQAFEHSWNFPDDFNGVSVLHVSWGIICLKFI